MSIRLWIKKWLLPLFLALMFCISQQHMLVHGISHLQDAQGQSQQEKHTGVGSFCDKCASYANLAGALPGAFSLPLAIAATHLLSTTFPARATAVLLQPYSARAPPFTR